MTDLSTAPQPPVSTPSHTDDPVELTVAEVNEALKRHNCELFLYCTWEQGKILPQLKVVEKTPHKEPTQPV